MAETGEFATGARQGQAAKEERTMTATSKWMMGLGIVGILLTGLSVQGTWFSRYGAYDSTIGDDVPYTSGTQTTANYSNSFDTDPDLADSAWRVTGSWGSANAPDGGPVNPETYVETATGSSTGLPAGSVGVGRYTAGNSAYWFDGYALWHVQAPEDTIFSGGTATMNAYHEGSWSAIYLPKYQWRLVDDQPAMETYGYSLGAGTTHNVLANFTRYAGDGGPGNGYYTEDLVVDIPPGLSEFWLIFDSNGANRNNTAYFNSLDIEATLWLIPEPGTAVLLAAGGLLALRRRR